MVGKVYSHQDTKAPRNLHAKSVFPAKAGISSFLSGDTEFQRTKLRASETPLDNFFLLGVLVSWWSKNNIPVSAGMT